MASNNQLAFVALLLLAAVATQHCEASRLLRQTKSPLRKHFQDKEDPGDPSGYLAFANSRAFVPRPSKANKQALTPEAAEAASNNLFNGIYRNMASGNRMSYATVESDPVTLNPNRKEEVVQVRARSAIDLVGIAPRAPNLSNGATQFPALMMGGVAYSNTYEGATSAAASDSIMVNQGGKRGRRGTTIANSMLTASTAALPAASRRGSFGTTAQPVGSMALSGNPNGRIQIAQADRAVAMAQTERVNSDPISRTAWQN